MVIKIAEGSEILSLLSTMVDMLKLQRISQRCKNAVSFLSERSFHLQSCKFTAGICFSDMPIPTGLWFGLLDLTVLLMELAILEVLPEYVRKACPCYREQSNTLQT